MRRIPRHLGTVAMLAILCVALAGCFGPLADDRVTITGGLLVADQNMVYAGGTPDPKSPPGEATINGCRTTGLDVGTTVTLFDEGFNIVGSGEVIETFHWERDPTAAVSRRNYGCSFRLEVKNAERRDLYRVSVGLGIADYDVRWAQLHDAGDETFVLPPYTLVVER